MLHVTIPWKNRRAWLLPFALIVAWVLPSEAAVDSSYSINPTKTAADKAFTLDLLTYQFNCGTTYDMLSASVNGNAISLTFLDHDAPTGTACPLIYRPYGPTFSLPGLHSGTYTVKAFRLPACAAQHCPFAAIPGVDAGTLVVGTSTGLLSQSPRGSDGAWRAELLTTTGRILKAFQFHSGSDSRVGLNAGVQIERGFYMLRVLGPSGEIHILPVVRKD